MLQHFVYKILNLYKVISISKILENYVNSCYNIYVTEKFRNYPKPPYNQEEVPMMKWFKCADSMDWGIEISQEGLVTEIQYQNGMERRTYKWSPKLHEESITGDVLQDAFWAIATSSKSKDGASYLADSVKNWAQQQALFEMSMKLNDLALMIQRKIIESHRGSDSK